MCFGMAGYEEKLVLEIGQECNGNVQPGSGGPECVCDVTWFQIERNARPIENGNLNQASGILIRLGSTCDHLFIANV